MATLLADDFARKAMSLLEGTVAIFLQGCGERETLFRMPVIDTAPFTLRYSVVCHRILNLRPTTLPIPMKGTRRFEHACLITSLMDALAPGQSS